MKVTPGVEIKEIRRLQRQYWNAFKHATYQNDKEREDKDLLAKFSDLRNDHALFIGVYDYGLAVNAMPIEAQAHHIWYIALYPEKLDPKHSKERYEQIFPDLRSKSRADQKQMLNEAINKARSDQQ